MTDLDPEDAKIVTLARSSRARTGASQGAAVRDTDGRTYAATTVALRALSLTALQAAVAAAVSSGAPGFEAVAVVGGDLSPDDEQLVAEIGVPAFVASADGTVERVVRP